ncbi:hypothetical protein B0H13DRAFT_2368458 [Mycena leptocephala]|nr:hypothetical protein B0H13DRAFT_2368458 [Mycena leptocephala]
MAQTTKTVPVVQRLARSLDQPQHTRSRWCPPPLRTSPVLDDYNPRISTIEANAGGPPSRIQANAGRSTGAREDVSWIVCLFDRPSIRYRCRLEPAEQVEGFLKLDPHVAFLDEGPGEVYFTAQLADDAVQQQRPDRLLSAVIVKWGVTRCLPRRQLDYGRCGEGRVHMWMMSYQVERRLLAEKMIHLRLAHEGYEHVYFDEACSCGHRHREYRYMKKGGSIAEIEEVVRWCLVRIGEADAKSRVLRPRRRSAQYSAQYRDFSYRTRR